MTRDSRLLDALSHPELLGELSLGDWDTLLPLARKARVQGRLAISAEVQGLLAHLPAPVLAHLRSARVLADKHEQVMRWELDCIARALEKIDAPVALLKGAAYVAADLPPSRGRLYSDVDILVPKASLRVVEHALLLHGWMAMKLHPYDQRYYRRWMHELPPLRHRRRQTVIDVHHTILPETARQRPDATELIRSSVAPSSGSFFRVLAPEDMVLHSATHLFYEGEFDSGMRDLCDLNDLLRLYSTRESFWEDLVRRALHMQLSRPLYYGLRYAHLLLDTPVPASCLAAIAPHGPGPLRRRLMDALFLRGLVPEGEDHGRLASRLARELLYIRGHYLRMPLYLLIPHLLHKAFRGKRE